LLMVVEHREPWLAVLAEKANDSQLQAKSG
jgi:hypothetical protein